MATDYVRAAAMCEHDPVACADVPAQGRDTEAAPDSLQRAFACVGPCAGAEFASSCMRQVIVHHAGGRRTKLWGPVRTTDALGVRAHHRCYQTPE